jgi:hypothetical protein
MKQMLYVVRSQPFKALIAAFWGALIGLAVAYLLRFLHDLIAVDLLATEPPPFATELVLPGLGFLIVAGHAFAGVLASIGFLRGTLLGRILYYGSESAYVWGIFGMTVSGLLGIGFVNAIRLSAGLEATLLTEPSVVFGGIMSVVGFLIGAGVLSDWMLWSVGEDAPLKHGAPAGKPEWFRYLSIDVNHKVIGIQYGYTSLLVLVNWRPVCHPVPH